jgi:hypothetical protein
MISKASRSAGVGLKVTEEVYFFLVAADFLIGTFPSSFPLNTSPFLGGVCLVSYNLGICVGGTGQPGRDLCCPRPLAVNASQLGLCKMHHITNTALSDSGAIPKLRFSTFAYLNCHVVILRFELVMPRGAERGAQTGATILEGHNTKGANKQQQFKGGQY